MISYSLHYIQKSISPRELLGIVESVCTENSLPSVPVWSDHKKLPASNLAESFSPVILGLFYSYSNFVFNPGLYSTQFQNLVLVLILSRLSIRLLLCSFTAFLISSAHRCPVLENGLKKKAKQLTIFNCFKWRFMHLKTKIYSPNLHWLISRGKISVSQPKQRLCVTLKLALEAAAAPVVCALLSRWRD